jgi:hypothetical protein
MSLLGLAIALAPQALFLASVVNPAGLAISAAICCGQQASSSYVRATTAPGSTPQQAESSIQRVCETEERLREDDGVSHRALLLIAVTSGLVESFTVAWDLLVILGGAGFMFASRQIRPVLLAFVALAVLAPTLISASQALRLGSIVWEGKDGMPLWVGLPLAAASASATWWSRYPQTSRLLLAAAGAAQFAAFLGATPVHDKCLRFLELSTVPDGWSPATPPLVLLSLYALALLLGWGFLLSRPAHGQQFDVTVLPL